MYGLLYVLWVSVVGAAVNSLESNALLKRCPCVPINTCYSQGISLNEQNYLNQYFQCVDHMKIHCCGPYYPTLGSEDFYFDESNLEPQKWRAGEKYETVFVGNPPEKVMVVMAEKATTAPPARETVQIVTVVPEILETTTQSDESTTMLDFAEATTVKTEEITTTEFIDDITESPEVVTKTSTNEVEATTDYLTTSIPSTTVKEEQHKTGKYLKRKPTKAEREFHQSEPHRMRFLPTVTPSKVRSTTPNLRVVPIRKSLYNAEFRKRYLSARLNKPASTSTSSN
ncbi:uncharacterized protein LOC129745945 [Uranotaenia lowii]|uniref:uncharacterized protein LOC129745945 n=1 Tax=Uranotaenia lowii TaxID=190385 RepID=UPI0024791AF3|nr:uncharacterized protein LOC129745945 [Uranotaenia lowii]